MLYAAYGSNLHPLRLGRRLAKAELVGTSFLPDWSLQFHKRSVDGSGKCSIRPGEDGVHVAVFHIHGADKIKLDRIEGLGEGYDEISLQLEEFGTCFAYTARETHIDNSLLPYAWYKELVLLGARALAFPAAYTKRIQSIRARQDPDPGRHQEMWDLVESIEAQGWVWGEKGRSSSRA